MGQNCDRCPTNWYLVINDTRAIKPDWKIPFDYEEGCFPCSTCVSDLMGTANNLSDTMAIVLQDFQGLNSSYLATQKLNSIDDEVEKKLKSEIALLDPQVRMKKLTPLEGQVTTLQQVRETFTTKFHH